MTVATAPLEELVDQAAESIEALDWSAARAWKAAAPKRAIAGCFPVYSPVEVLHAAGVLPVGLAGGGNRIEIAHADARFQSFICSIIKSTLELGMTGKLADFDALVFHSICDPARNLASVYARNFPAQKVEYLHFPQRLHSAEAVDYLEREYERLLLSMSDLTDSLPDDQKLRASIELYDRNRALMRDLYRLRCDAPQLLSTRELYVLVRHGHGLPPEEHFTLLERASAAIAERGGRPHDRIRVLVAGSFCEQPPLDLIGAIEGSGCYVVDDDFAIGRRFLKSPVADQPGPPLRQLARAYVYDSVDASFKHDLGGPRGERFVARARECRADAVIILTAKFCEPALFDYALQRAALREAGIPHVFLEFEEKMWLFDKIKSEVETFVESLLFQ